MPTNYTGNPSAAQAPAPQPTARAIPIVALPVDGDSLNSASIYQPLKADADYIAYLMQNASLMGTNFFGGGGDGDATLDGSNSYSWASRVSSTYTLNRDVYLGNLTITIAPSILIPGGFRVFCSGTLNVQVGCAIRSNGTAASGSTGGASAVTSGSAGFICGYGSGGNGGTAAGSAATGPSDGGISESTAIGVGGAGGAGSSGAGGAGATSTTSAAGRAYRRLFCALEGYSAIFSSGSVSATIGTVGGVAGGGGGGDSTHAGGGGGGGGGHLIIVAKTLILDGTIEASGAAGGAGSSGNAGGGGGGSGGLIITAYSAKSGAGTFVVTGGTGGAGVGTGVNGVAGKPGLSLEFQL